MGYNSPLGPLLVEHTVSAILAANLIAALQRNASRALAAEVDDGWGVNGHGAAKSTLVAEGVLRTHRGDLVGFTRHSGRLVVGRRMRLGYCVR